MQCEFYNIIVILIIMIGIVQRVVNKTELMVIHVVGRVQEAIWEQAWNSPQRINTKTKTTPQQKLHVNGLLFIRYL